MGNVEKQCLEILDILPKIRERFFFGDKNEKDAVWVQRRWEKWRKSLIFFGKVLEITRKVRNSNIMALRFTESLESQGKI